MELNNNEEKQKPLYELVKFAISLDEETNCVDLKRNSSEGRF